MARNQQKNQQQATEINLDQHLGEDDAEEKRPFSKKSIELEAEKVNPAGDADIALHSADDVMADHYGSREETQAALEGKIASQNTLKLHGRF